MNVASNKIWNSVKKMGLSSYKNMIDTTKSILDYNDKFIVWIVGFAITTITLIIANSDKLSKITNQKNINLVIIFLSLSFFLGILYRLLSFTLLRYLSEIMIFIEIALSTDIEILDMDDDDIDRINESNDFIYIVDQIKDAGGDVNDQIIESYNIANNKDKLKYLNNLKTYYSEQVKYNKQHYDLAMRFVFDTYKKAFSLTQDELNKLLQNKDTVTDKNYKLINKYLIPITFYSSCISFLIAILTIIFAYLFK